MKARTFVTALLATLAVAAPASAATVSVQGGVLRIEGRVDLEAIQDGADFAVLDYTEMLEPGEGCTLDMPELPVTLTDRTMTCTGVTASVHATLDGSGGEESYNSIFLSSSLPVRFEGGAISDFLFQSGSGPVEASGGGGGDQLYGGEGADVIDGGPGDDMLRDGGGADRLNGGEGDDYLRGDGAECCFEPGPAAATGANTPDVLEGGNGSDSFEGVEPVDTVRGGSGRDSAGVHAQGPQTITLGAGALEVEEVYAGDGDVTLRGDERVNELSTGPGKDVIDPGTGVDLVFSGPGDDTISARDGFPDLIDCDEGADTVIADDSDEVESSCEHVQRAAVAATPAPAAAAAPSLIAPAALRFTTRRRGRATVVRGRLILPAGTNPKLCDGGGVVVRSGRRRAGTTLNARCEFSVKLKGRAGRVKVQFAGTPALAPVSR